MAARLVVVCTSLSVLLLGSVAVDKNNFKTCSPELFLQSEPQAVRGRDALQSGPVLSEESGGIRLPDGGGVIAHRQEAHDGRHGSGGEHVSYPYR
ncbi:hypothetical protein GBAR_LOCUS20942 [Geodia barretti]|uniref:Uncharacterized protein n=1 Tax=Geodia barretti TaxID=519541 RepID=A0AA35SXY9_GEOBA|nr:hypothetical protein GBAR_LOCUS20942 [Geodia barretti]